MSDTNMNPGTESQIDYKALLDAAHLREERAYGEIKRLERELAGAKAAPTTDARAGADAQKAAMKAMLDLVLRAKVRKCEYGVEPEGGWPAWVDACWELGAAPRPVGAP